MPQHPSHPHPHLSPPCVHRSNPHPSMRPPPSLTRRSHGEPSVSRGGEHAGLKRQCGSSRYLGVSWNKAGSSWKVHLSDPETSTGEAAHWVLLL
jgi:hypothetical protein